MLKLLTLEESQLANEFLIFIEDNIMNNSDKDFQLNLIKIKLILKSENQENKDFVDTYSQFCNLNTKSSKEHDCFKLILEFKRNQNKKDVNSHEKIDIFLKKFGQILNSYEMLTINEFQAFIKDIFSNPNCLSYCFLLLTYYMERLKKHHSSEYSFSQEF